MSKAKRRKREKRAVEQSAESQTPETSHGRRTTIIIIALFVILIILIVWINRYFSEDQKYYRIDIVTVDGTSIGMDEFVRRCHATGSNPMSMFTTLTQEIIIQKEAELLELEVSDEAIDERLREIARGTSESITESEFKEWYRQRINESGLTDKEYRDMIASDILEDCFRELVSSVTPTTAEQVHLNIIILDTEENALEAIARFEAGESFADLAGELSLDTTSGENGGDIGWIPRRIVFNGKFDDIIFNLAIGEISEPAPLYDISIDDPTSVELINYYLFFITEKADAREVNEEYLNMFYNNAFNDWMSQKIEEYDIRFNGINGDFDSTTYSWINWQLQKLDE